MSNVNTITYKLKILNPRGTLTSSVCMYYIIYIYYILQYLFTCLSQCFINLNHSEVIDEY